MTATVRRARLEDVEDIYEVVKLAFENYRKIGYQEDAIRSAIVSKSEIQHRLNKELILVAEF